MALSKNRRLNRAVAFAVAVLVAGVVLAVTIDAILIVRSTTQPQLSIRYDDSNKIDTSVTSGGVATMDATTAPIKLSDDLTVTDDTITLGDNTDKILTFQFDTSSYNPAITLTNGSGVSGSIITIDHDNSAGVTQFSQPGTPGFSIVDEDIATGKTAFQGPCVDTTVDYCDLVLIPGRNNGLASRNVRIRTFNISGFQTYTGVSVEDTVTLGNYADFRKSALVAWGIYGPTAGLDYMLGENDDDRFCQGAAKDACQRYDGTDWIFDPDVVGTGDVVVAGGLRVSSTAAEFSSGTGSPEGVVTAAVGSIFTRTDGGAATSLYVKESGSGNTGWVAK